MPRVCHFTGRRSVAGWKKAHKSARKDGGVKHRVMSRTKRQVKPNLKKVRCIVDGEVKRVYVSTKALKSGLVIKPGPATKPTEA